jgi:pyruvyl transferase EpsO
MNHHLQEQIGLSSNDAAVMRSLKEKLNGILGYFDTSRRVVLYDYPLHLNVGDLLIQKGTEQFLAEHNIHLWKRYSVYDMPSAIRGMDKDVVILCHGGGNLGDLYPLFQNGRDRVLELYPRNPILVLPQSVHFDSQARLQQSMQKFRSHANCHIFARDELSLDILQRAGMCRSSAMPDMAHCLWRRLVADKSADFEAQPLRLARHDKESKASDVLQGKGSGEPACDWSNIVALQTSRYARLTIGVIRKQSELGLTMQKYWQWRPMQDRAIQDAVRCFSRYQTIYTNRLHALLLGLLLERKVCAFDNSYGKLSSYSDTWLSKMDGLTWEPDV